MRYFPGKQALSQMAPPVCEMELAPPSSCQRTSAVPTLLITVRQRSAVTQDQDVTRGVGGAKALRQDPAPQLESDVIGLVTSKHKI